MSVNFEAKLSLEISQFMRNLATAENAFDKLAKKVQNTKLVVGTASAAATGAVPKNPKNTAAKDADDIVKNRARERYALYDVAAAYQQVARAGTAALTAMVGAATQYERSFADVVRTTEFASTKIGEAARVMKTELLNISTEIPLAFGKITEIATIGNQLGIAQGSLEDFTTTVAKFAATTDVSTENAAMSFGRIGELLDVEDFNALGSAIAYAGVNAVATETQILATSKEIATTAKQAKFAAPDVIGLATALSSLGIAPEAARGSVIRSFAGINKAISEGGATLSQYAALSGMTAEQFSSQWQQNGQVAFDALLRGLQRASDGGANLDSVLRDLGVKNVRDIQTLQKLGDNYDVYAQSIRDANSAFEEGTFLSQAYGVVQETLASKLEILTNNWNNLLATLGEGATGDLFKFVIDAINNALTGITNFMKTPLAQGMMPWVLVSIGLATAIAGINAVAALASASILAYGTAMGVATEKTIVLKNGTIQTKTSINAMAVASKAANVAMKSLVPIAIISAGIAIFGRLADSMAPVEQKAENILGGFGGLQDALSKDLAAYNDALASNNGDAAAASDAAGIWYEVAAATSEGASKAEENAEAMDRLGEVTGVTAGASSELNGQLSTMNVMLGKNTAEWIKNAIYQSETFRELAKNKDAMDAIIASGFNVDEALRAVQENNLPGYMQETTAAAMETASWFEQVTYNAYSTGGALGWLATIVPRLINELTLFFGIDLFPVSDGLQAMETAISGAVAETALLGGLTSELSSALDGLTESAEETEDGLGGVSDALRTVVDYANELNGVLSRTVELKFGKQIALDAITSGWQNISESASKAEEDIKSANDEIKNLTADRGILEYQLSVAIRYGDEARAAQLRAKLAQNQADIDKQNSAIEDANASQDKTLVGDSGAALENRKDVLGMVSAYQDYATMLAKLGAKPDELAKEIGNMKKDFLKQGKAAGYSAEELEKYLSVFDEFGTVATEMPRDVDIEVNADLSAAEQAILEFISKQRDTTVGVNSDTSTAEENIEDFLSENRFFTPAEMLEIETRAADGTLDNWLYLHREFGAPIVTGITADAADRKITDWLNESRTLAALRLETIETLVADGSVESWLLLERYFGAPHVDDINTVGADADVQAWLAEERRFSEPIMDKIATTLADGNVENWLNAKRYLGAPAVTTMTADGANTAITNWLNKIRYISPPKISQIDSSGAKSAIDGIVRYGSTKRIKLVTDIYAPDGTAIPGRVLPWSSFGYAEGGFVSGPGTGTSDSIPAMLSNGEYVMKASAVSAYGVDFFNAINQQKVSTGAGVSGGSPASAGGTTVAYLSPEDRALLRAAVDRPINLYADSTKIAQTANEGNTLIARRGSR